MTCSLPPEPELLQPTSITVAGYAELRVTATAPIAPCLGLDPTHWIITGPYGEEGLLDIDIFAGGINLSTETPAAQVSHVLYDGGDPCLKDAEGTRLAAFSVDVPYAA